MKNRNMNRRKMRQRLDALTNDIQPALRQEKDERMDALMNGWPFCKCDKCKKMWFEILLVTHDEVDAEIVQANHSIKTLIKRLS